MSIFWYQELTCNAMTDWWGLCQVQNTRKGRKGETQREVLKVKTEKYNNNIIVQQKFSRSTKFHGFHG